MLASSNGTETGEGLGWAVKNKIENEPIITKF